MRKVLKGDVCAKTVHCASKVCQGIVKPHEGDTVDLRCNKCGSGYRTVGCDVVSTGVTHQRPFTLGYQT